MVGDRELDLADHGGALGEGVPSRFADFAGNGIGGGDAARLQSEGEGAENGFALGEGWARPRAESGAGAGDSGGDLGGRGGGAGSDGGARGEDEG